MRGKQAPKRNIPSDTKYNSVTVAKFINYVMSDGKKSIAKDIVYTALNEVGEKSKQNALTVFEEAIKNITPSIEVRSRRIGGANYQIPTPVRGERRMALAFRWLLAAADAKKGKPMAQKLSSEILSASTNEGEAVKKRNDVHRMAEANRAFAHFAR